MTTNNIHSLCQKRTAYAWAKYYQALNDNHTTNLRNYENLTKTADKFPEHIKQELKEHYKLLKKDLECPICLDVIPLNELEITGCGHKYCKKCYKNITNCAICRYIIKK